MSCVKRDEAKYGGPCRCGDCARRQELALVKYLNGECDLYSAVSPFGVDCPKDSVKAVAMEKALLDAKSDLMNLRQPFDLGREVSRLREELWEIAEGR